MSAIAAAWRRLPWWVEPVTVASVLTVFGVYSFTVVLLFDGGYREYLSPFYSPEVGLPGWVPDFITAPMFVLWIPLGLRATCYYYRKAYYQAFFWDPPDCLSDAQKHDHRIRGESYRGERAVFVLNNVHRYFLYGSFVILAFLWYDTYLTFFTQEGFQIRAGSLIWLANVVLLSLYSISCHSMRHLIGGRKDCFTCIRGGGARRRAYNGVSRLTARHPHFAWFSLVSVLLADVYLRLIAAGIIPDLPIIG